MKKIIISIIGLLFINICFSQDINLEKPDFDKIKKEINKKRSDFYYKKLFSRYLANDTNFTLSEKRHLYYGFSFQKEYSPYGHSTYQDSLEVFYSKEHLDEKDFEDIVKYCHLILDEYPFNLSALGNIRFAYFNLNNTELEMIYNYKYFLIIDAIVSSGDGLSEETAYSVIEVPHEYAILEVLGFNFGGEQSLITGGYDYLNLEENKYNIEGFYFEITRCLNHLNIEMK